MFQITLSKSTDILDHISAKQAKLHSQNHQNSTNTSNCTDMYFTRESHVAPDTATARDELMRVVLSTRSSAWDTSPQTWSTFLRMHRFFEVAKFKKIKFRID